MSTLNITVTPADDLIDVPRRIVVTGARPHALTPFARVDGTRITYPPEQPGLL